MTSPTEVQRAPWAIVLVQLLERAFWTWAEALAMVLIGSSFFETGDLSVLAAAAVATIPAAITVVVNFVTALVVPEDWSKAGQIAFRVAKTYIAVFLGFLAAGSWVVDLQSMKLLVVAAIGAAGAALGAALKAEVATYFGNRRTTATLPVTWDPVTPVQLARVA